MLFKLHYWTGGKVVVVMVLMATDSILPVYHYSTGLAVGKENSFLHMLLHTEVVAWYLWYTILYGGDDGERQILMLKAYLWTGNQGHFKYGILHVMTCTSTVREGKEEEDRSSSLSL